MPGSTARPLLRLARARADAAHRRAERARQDAASRVRDAAVAEAREVLDGEHGVERLAERYRAARAALLALVDAAQARNDAMAEQAQRLHAAGVQGISLSNRRALTVDGRQHLAVTPGDVALVLVAEVAEARDGLPCTGASSVEVILRREITGQLHDDDGRATA